MTLKQYFKKRNLKKSGEPSVYARNNREAKNKKSEAFGSSLLGKRGHEQEAKISKQKKVKNKIFVVHDHHASHHHFDLRLEMNGTLKSWAVPKTPPTTKGVKRLAIQVEDHPLSYAKFEGEIPEGNYGAGKVEIWDNGNYELIEKDKKTPEGVYPKRAREPLTRPRNIFKKMFTKGKIEIEMKGKKLKGKYVLIKTHYGSKPEKSWLFFKI